jgi:hypothetical protein
MFSYAELGGLDIYFWKLIVKRDTVQIMKRRKEKKKIREASLEKP